MLAAPGSDGIVPAVADPLGLAAVPPGLAPAPAGLAGLPTAVPTVPLGPPPEAGTLTPVDDAESPAPTPAGVGSGPDGMPINHVMSAEATPVWVLKLAPPLGFAPGLVAPAPPEDGAGRGGLLLRVALELACCTAAGPPEAAAEVSGSAPYVVSAGANTERAPTVRGPVAWLG